jgi:translation initiation factor 1 (eIF-1/SUI1)
MNEFEDKFYNPETELDDKYSNEIHLHRISRGARKSDVIVQGLVFKTNEESKEFIKLVSKKFGISGCQKTMEDYDKKNKIYIFTGDKRDEIANILIEKYNYDNDFIKYHG